MTPAWTLTKRLLSPNKDVCNAENIRYGNGATIDRNHFSFIRVPDVPTITMGRTGSTGKNEYWWQP
jgi:hypothetical protein